MVIGLTLSLSYSVSIIQNYVAPPTLVHRVRFFLYENLLGLINLIMQARDSFLSLLSVGGTLLVS